MSQQLHYAVVDQGSTQTKCALCDASGRTFVEFSEKTSRRDRDGRIEVDAEAVGASVERLLEKVIAGASVAAIALTCQRSTCLLWDRASGRALTPALSWQDTSQTARAEALAAHADDVAARSGLRLSPHYAATKLAALLDETPDGRERAAQGEIVAGTLDAFLMHRLTGTPATEPGHAGRSLLYNLDQGSWDSELCRLFDVPPGALPTLRTSAGYWGEYRGIPVRAGAGDQQAALIGHGGWREGTVAVHFGTGAFVLAATGSRIRRHDGLLSAVTASTPHGRRFQLEGTVNSAGSAADWVCGLTGESLADWVDRDIVPEEVPWVVPAFAGLGAPWWQPRARGLIHGIGTGTRGSDLLGGVLFGIAMRVVDNLEAMAKSGTRPEVVRVSGKLTRLHGLIGLISDAAKVSVEVTRNEETGLLGICRLAAASLSGDLTLLELAPPVITRRDPQWSADRVASVRQRWSSLIALSSNG
ncbi:MAG: FGGY family carbohydrate kinase [Acidobacteria bacterium]|nr:FGGY family carbohydrate kinase [Acidobacteriota bacterium]